MTIQWQRFDGNAWTDTTTTDAMANVGGIESVHCERHAADAAARYGSGVWYAAGAPYRVVVA